MGESDNVCAMQCKLVTDNFVKAGVLKMLLKLPHEETGNWKTLKLLEGPTSKYIESKKCGITQNLDEYQL